jgi:hypothetical protein
MATPSSVTDAGTARHCLLTHSSGARLSGDPRGPSSPTFAPVEAARGEQGQAAELICRSPRGTSAARR